MKFNEEDLLVRIYLSEDEKYHGKLLYKYIVEKCYDLDISGVTVFKGILGYGADKRIHSKSLTAFSENLPIKIEIIDTPEKIKQLKELFDKIIEKGFIAIEKIHSIKYR